MPAPSKSEREKCWEARDAMWSCMEKNNEDASKCKKERKLFEGSCTKTWVKYFDKRRDYLLYKDKYEQGLLPEQQEAQKEAEAKAASHEKKK